MKPFAQIVVAAALFLPNFTAAQVDVAEFDSAEKEALYADLITELRCLVCANQSLADSNANLARDLRAMVRERVRAGQNRAEIVEFLVARYGEYVLYRPRFSAANWFLWLAPFAVAVGGFAVVFGMARRRRNAAPYSAAELQKARRLLDDEGD